MDKSKENRNLGGEEPLQNSSERCYENSATSGYIRSKGKVCTGCKTWKPLQEFGRRNDRKKSIRGTCKGCLALKRRFARSNRDEEVVRTSEDGVAINLKLKPTAEFWTAYGMMLDWICENEFRTRQSVCGGKEPMDEIGSSNEETPSESRNIICGE
ncbi:MAG: hypothetical protein R3B45_07560 [Bdellovibrionota bacterium]